MIQISLRIHAVRSKSLLDAVLLVKGATFLHVDHEDSDQTARMRRPISVFVGRTCQKVRFLNLRIIYIFVSDFIKKVYFHENNVCFHETMCISMKTISP